MKMQGVHVANVSFFKASGELDLDALDKHLHFLATSGVHGFVPCGTTGEGATLRHDEWVAVVQRAVAVAKGKGIQVTAGCGSNSTSVVAEMMQEAKRLGADAALVVTPYYNKPTQSGLLAHYTHLANAAKNGGLPIVLYNVPGRTAVSLSAATIKALWALPEIIAIKEASASYALWEELSCELDLQKKALLAGDDDAYAIVMGFGGSGIISASANVAPRAFVAIHDLFAEGNWRRAFELQAQLLPLVKAMFLETNPAPAKCALSILHDQPETLRLPLVPVCEASRKIIGEAVSGLEQMP